MLKGKDPCFQILENLVLLNRMQIWSSLSTALNITIYIKDPMVRIIEEKLKLSLQSTEREQQTLRC